MPMRRGFTLIELLVVVMILGLVAAIVLPRIASSTGDARKTTCASNIRILNAQIELWTVTNGGTSPSGGGGLGAASTEKTGTISSNYVGTYPSTQSEFEQKILDNADIFPNGPPKCPYGDAYEYDPSTNRIKLHTH